MVMCTGKRVKNFKRDERGTFSVIMVGMLTSIILIGGTAIDLLRYEFVRSSLQYSLDGAVLAAASMSQTQDPATVVDNYMSKVEALGSFSVTMNETGANVSLTSRSVSAEVTASYSTYFLRIAGMNAIDVFAASSATEEIPNMEISLVLDVSGSMLGSKIASLKSAANTFVDTVVDLESDSLTSISLIAYASNVALPQNMWDLYNVTEVQSESRCIVFDSASYSTAGIPTTSPLRQLMNFDQYDSWQHKNECKTSDNAVYYNSSNSYAVLSEIKPFMTDPVEIKAEINALDAMGSTASHIGTKWGLALLDPEARDVGIMVGGSVASRPEPYNTPGVLKILVVMTDGDNRSHKTLKDGYRTGESDVWAITTDVCYDYYYNKYTCSLYDAYYIKSESNGAYYRLGRGPSYWNIPGTSYAVHGQANYRRRLDWEEVWGTTTVYDPYYNSYDKLDVQDYASESSQYTSTFQQTYTSSSEADTQMKEACSAAKQNNNVVVYTIAFSAPSNAQTLLESCATLGRDYIADDDSIDEVFAAIAVSVQKLKLTQ